MSKDPAFLFYSKDFYEGTRTMLPQERACYIDLLIYQHQHNGIIPNELKRVLLYCNGIDQATLEATLKAKFKLTDKGWVNTKLNAVVLDRTEFKNKQSINGKIGQFWKKCKAYLSTEDYKKMRLSLENIDNIKIFEFLENKKIEKDTLEGLLEALLKHLVIENANVNVIVNKEFIPPTLKEVTNYCNQRKNKINPERFLNYYSSRNWMLGSNKMYDWQACIRTWEDKDNNQNNGTEDDNR